MVAVTLEVQLEGTNLTLHSGDVVIRILLFGECLQVIKGKGEFGCTREKGKEPLTKP